MSDVPNTQYEILRLNDVVSCTSLPKSTIYSLAKEGKFPSPIRLAKRSSGWLKSEVQDFIQARINESRGAMKGGA